MSRIILIIVYSILLVVSIFSVTSCVSTKKMIYMQGLDSLNDKELKIAQTYEFTIQTDDQLAISINCKEEELLAPFNSNILVGSGNNGSSTNAQANVNAGITYFQVDKEGNIHFPVFGAIKVAGKTRSEIERILEHKLEVGNYAHNPTVTVKLMSFKITVLGEVAKPGTQKVSGEKLTILEALGMAGDLLPSGRRENITVLRDIDGVHKKYVIDLTSGQSILESPCYFLKQNDVVYVEPNSAIKIKGSASTSFLSTGGTIVSILASIVSLIFIIAK